MSAAVRGGRKKLVPAAQACGPTNIWLAKREGRGGWSQPSAPGTTALSLAWTGEACSLQTEAAEREQEGRRENEKLESHQRRRNRTEKFASYTLKAVKIETDCSHRGTLSFSLPMKNLCSAFRSMLLLQSSH